MRLAPSFIKFFAALSLIFISLSQYGYGSNVIDVNRGRVQSIPIAIMCFTQNNSSCDTISYNIQKVISNDLTNSGIFKPINQKIFIQKKLSPGKKPLFASWSQINAQLLVTGNIISKGKNREIEFTLWDVILKEKMASYKLPMPTANWRKAAHLAANKLYEHVTGYAGYFDSQIVYVSEDGEYTKRRRRLAIVDQDGANHRFLTNGKNLVLTPRFSPDGKSLLYLSYRNDQPTLYNLNLSNMQTSKLGKFSGMPFAPQFSPDGSKMVMSIAEDGATNIYEYNLKTKKNKQLTFSKSDINTSPYYSPDGKNIVYNSDVGGRRQLYMMSAGGGNKRRISFGGGSYFDPRWSIRGILAFTKISKYYGFAIGVMKPQAATKDEAISEERLLTTGYIVESPAWSKTGQMLAFTRGERTGRKKNSGFNRIYIIDINGNYERILPTPHDASDPDWSR